MRRAAVRAGKAFRVGMARQRLVSLCLALALLALHMEAWETVVGDLTRALAPSADDAASKLPCLLELLTVLPEEADNYKVGVTPKRRADFVKMLRASSAQAPHRPRRPELARRTHCAPPPRAAWRAARRADPTAQVLALSAHVCEQCRSQEATTKRMLGCVASWMRHCSLPSAELAASPLLAPTAPPAAAVSAQDVLKCCSFSIDSITTKAVALWDARGCLANARGSRSEASIWAADLADPHWKRGMLGTATLSVPLGVFGHGSRKNPTNAKLLTISARRFKRVDVTAVRDRWLPTAVAFRRLWEITTGRTSLYV